MRIHFGTRLPDLLRQPVVTVIATAVSQQTLGTIIAGFSITCWASLKSKFTFTQIEIFFLSPATHMRPAHNNVMTVDVYTILITRN